MVRMVSFKLCEFYLNKVNLKTNQNTLPVALEEICFVEMRVPFARLLKPYTEFIFPCGRLTQK